MMVKRIPASQVTEGMRVAGMHRMFVATHVEVIDGGLIRIEERASDGEYVTAQMTLRPDSTVTVRPVA